MTQFAGAARFAYNWALEQQDKNHKEGGKFLSDCDLRKQFIHSINKLTSGFMI